MEEGKWKGGSEMRKGSENTGVSEQGREGMESTEQRSGTKSLKCRIFRLLFSLLLYFENLKSKILIKNSCRQAAARLQPELNSELSQICPVCSQVSFSTLGRLQSEKDFFRCSEPPRYTQMHNNFESTTI